jgi:hypothetical protein
MKLVHWRLPRYLSEEDDSLVLDLGDVTFVLPEGLVAIATFAESIRQSGRTLSVEAPDSTDIANYMSRAHLPQVLDDLGVDHDFEPVRERDLGSSMVELRRFDGVSEVLSLADGVFEFARPQGERSAAMLHTAVCETGENVTIHSGTQHGYLLAQYYPSSRTFRFAIGDNGIGFFGSLQTVGAASVEQALEMAGRPGFSATGDPTRGLGISSVREHLIGLGGTLVLASENQERGFNSLQELGHSSSNTGHIVGSLVYGNFSATRAATN